MSQVLRLRNVGDTSYEEVDDNNPLPVKAIQQVPSQYVAFDTQILTVDNTAGGVKLRAVSAAAADRVVMRLSGAEISLLYDTTNTSVTTSNGTLMEISDTLQLDGTTNIQNFRAIRTTGTSGTLAVSFERITPPVL